MWESVLQPSRGKTYDFPIQGLTVPDINPLEIIEKNIKITEEIARSFPDMIIVGQVFLVETDMRQRGIGHD